MNKVNGSKQDKIHSSICKEYTCIKRMRRKRKKGQAYRTKRDKKCEKEKAHTRKDIMKGWED
jgi:hypothetical protein